MEKAASGEDVVITREDGAAFKIVPLHLRQSYPKFGSARGLIEMRDDFDEPLADFKDYEK
ncbi:MAG: DUF2281 domain-containing protein [bacterium]|nr:DUF2281 domain-containing protein [bacterium]